MTRPTIPRRSLLGAALPLITGACSPFDIANGLTPDGDAALRSGIPYGAGDRARYDLYTPAGAGPRTPLVVFLYGGGWRSGARGDYAFIARSLARAGLVVAVPDYRLFPGARWPDFVEDGAAALRAILSGPGAGRPVFLLGHSAGAFIAVALAVDPRWLGAARTALAGTIGLAGPYEFGPEDDPDGIFAAAPGGRARVAPPDPAAMRGAAPLLLFQGEADETVHPAQAGRFAALAGAAGVEATARLFPGVGHIGILTALARPVRALGLEGAPVYEAVTGWIADRAGGGRGDAPPVRSSRS